MLDGFVRVAAATPKIRVADCAYNAEQIISLIKRVDTENIRLVCMPELCITGYTCGDLFLQGELLESAKNALFKIVAECAKFNVLAAVGLPLEHNGKLFNVAAVFCRGKILGFVPKTHIPNYGEFYELRYFTAACAAGDTDNMYPRQLIRLEAGYGFRSDEKTSSPNSTGRKIQPVEFIPFGTKLIFECEEMPELKLAVEICEDAWAPNPPSTNHATAGATIIFNLSASTETAGKAAYRRLLASGHSARLLCGYVYSNAGYGESTTDVVFSAHNLICENGTVFAESPPFGEGWAVSEIDLTSISHDRRRMNIFAAKNGYVTVPFSLNTHCGSLTRKVSPTPFIPENNIAVRCEEILNIQSHGLLKRLDHIGAKAVLGISGGLDSTLALLVTARAYGIMSLAKAEIIAITMPCFGTTERTKNNAHKLCEAMGIPCREIDITETVRQHLRDINHPENHHDITYENAQARIRTLVLMDVANQNGGIVIGTGGLSELALGWTTYNGDHMNMYGVNAGVPKTLVRHLVNHAAETGGEMLKAVLEDILRTPVSPELLPPKDGEIIQQTESILGKYELHDFFIYHTLRWGRKPSQILALAQIAFSGKYTNDEIQSRLKLFYSRFFSQQFKRSCLPDAPKVGTVSLSPRGDWRMPSDAVCSTWLDGLE